MPSPRPRPASAELVAEGLTNPQVAKELLMGAETVKTHLSRVFDKIGVANRKELIVAGSRRAAERHR
ncbi:MAG: helix-turn-helix transcriptional regulator [Microthrixaceae bacterium]